MNGVSIVVCCYNSSKKLPETIRHLALQKVPENINWEIIIVDNNSKDNTRETAYNEWGKYNLATDFSVVNQPVPGLSNARDKGIESAKYDYIVFCDDDNWLVFDYVHRGYVILESNKSVAACGGLGIPVFESDDRPDLFSKFRAAYAIDQQYSLDGIIKKNYLFGAGLFFKKSVYKAAENCGFVKVLTDRVGSKLTSGGDSEICAQFKIMGYDLYYDSNLTYHHFLQTSRLNNTYLKKLIESFGESDAILSFYNYGIARKNVSYLLYFKQILSTVKKVFSYIFIKDKLYRNVMVASGIRKLMSLFSLMNSIFELISTINKIKAMTRDNVSTEIN